MAKVGAQRAAELTGRSKSTIQRAMEAGKLSFEVGDNGRRVVDVSELERVFGLAGSAANDRKKPSTGMANVAELERAQLRVKALEDQMFLMTQQTEDLKGQRDSWQKQAQQLAITHQVTQDQAADAKKQAEDYKSQVDTAKKEAEEAKRQLEDLKKIAAQMKQRIVQQQGNRPQPAGQRQPASTPKAKPQTILELLGFAKTGR